MSTPKTAPARLHAGERRQQLLETALDCFSRRGFTGTTTKAIATAAGVTEAIIFRHFPSKQALYRAVLDYHRESAQMQNWLAVTKECMERNDDAGLLRAMALQILGTYRRDARLQRVLLFAALEGHEQGLAHFRQTSIPIFEPLCQYIARRQGEGKLLAYDPGMIIAAIVGMAANFASMNHMFGFECDMPDERAADIFTSIMMTGIQAGKEPTGK